MANYLNGFGEWFQDEVHEWMLGQAVSYVPTATQYCALGVQQAEPPTPDGLNFIEPTIGGYARVPVAQSYWSATQGPAQSYQTITQNNQKITFPTATDTWGTVAYFAMFKDSTASTEDRLIWGGSLTVTKLVTATIAPTFSVGNAKLISSNTNI